jgi:hypothetical protein
MNAPRSTDFGEPQIVELSILVGAYNMHTRVMAALAIDPQPVSEGGPGVSS